MHVGKWVMPEMTSHIISSPTYLNHLVYLLKLVRLAIKETLQHQPGIYTSYKLEGSIQTALNLLTTISRSVTLRSLWPSNNPNSIQKWQGPGSKICIDVANIGTKVSYGG